MSETQVAPIADGACPTCEGATWIGGRPCPECAPVNPPTVVIVDEEIPF